MPSLSARVERIIAHCQTRHGAGQVMYVGKYDAGLGEEITEETRAEAWLAVIPGTKLQRGITLHRFDDEETEAAFMARVERTRQAAGL
jgi:hypothetical protein